MTTTSTASTVSNSSARRAAAALTAAVLGLGIIGVTATPAYAVTVTDTASLNTAIAANDPQIIINNDFTLTANITSIAYDLDIIGNGHTINAAGLAGFEFSNSTFTVSDLTVENASSRGFGVAFGAGDTGSFTNVSTTGGAVGIQIAATGNGDSVTITGGTHSSQGLGISIDALAANATASITGTQFSVHTSAAIYVNVTGTMQYTITDVTINNAGDGIQANSTDTAVVTITNPTIADANRGIEAYAYGTGRINIVDADITAGPTHNAVESGSGLYAEIGDSAILHFSGGAITPGPGGEHFIYGCEAYVNNSSTVTVSNSTINGHRFGVYGEVGTPAGVFELLRSIVTDSGWHGVTLWNEGTALIDQSTLDSNARYGLSLGLSGSTTGSHTTISRTTISNNDWSALDADATGANVALTVISSTISGNGGGSHAVRVAGDGDTSQQFSLLNSTVTNNTSIMESVRLSAIYLAFIKHSIVSGNTPGGSSPELVSADGSNIFAEWSVIGTHEIEGGGNFWGSLSNAYTGSPGLGPLANNGGPTLTHALLTSSPALNTGNPSIVGAPATDQRGENRIVGVIDMGAFEVQPAFAATGTSPGTLLTLAALLLTLGAAIVTIGRRTLKA